MKNARLLVLWSLSYLLAATLSLYANPKSKRLELSNEYLVTGQQEQAAGNFDKALNCYSNAARLNPNSLIATFNVGLMLQALTNLKGAIKAYQQAQKIDPSCAQAYYNCGVCYADLKDFAEAATYFHKALTINQTYEKAYEQLGLALKHQNKHQEAFEIYAKLLTFKPTSLVALRNCARSLAALDQLTQAIPYFEQALLQDPQHVSTLFEFANVLNMLDRTDEALALYEILAIRYPQSPEILYNYAYTLKKVNRVEESIPYYQKAITLKPDYAQAHFSLALAYLVSGDFKHGLEKYDWRWASYNDAPKKFNKPLWDGADLTGKTIYVYAEQGLGDTFQFIRYLKLLKEQGATVIFETQKPLKDILQHVPYIDKLTIQGQKDLPHFDTYIPLMSIPRIMGTDLTSIPAEIPYIFADPVLVDYWKEALSHDTNFKIGICWQGNPDYRTAALRHAVAAKSMNAATFAPLAQVPGVSFYSLQKVTGEKQLNDLPEGFVVHAFTQNFDEEHGRFMDTAAVIQNLDLMITIDTSICHLSAALGKPVWLLLPNPADWRWMLDRLDSPWYPNMRLFRQETPGDWQGLMMTVCGALEQYVREHSAR